jgi:hypothetical protein
VNGRLTGLKAVSPAWRWLRVSVQLTVTDLPYRPFGAAQAIDDEKSATKNIALEKIRIVPPMTDRTMVQMFSHPVNVGDRPSRAQPQSNRGYG